MESKTNGVKVFGILSMADTAAFMIVSITFLILISLPLQTYSAMCTDPDKSTAFFGGYGAAQHDFHLGLGKNPKIDTNSSQYSQDYKQGYHDGWSDAELNINSLERSVC
jgi:hypothetical protein